MYAIICPCMGPHMWYTVCIIVLHPSSMQIYDWMCKTCTLNTVVSIARWYIVIVCNGYGFSYHDELNVVIPILQWKARLLQFGSCDMLLLLWNISSQCWWTDLRHQKTSTSTRLYRQYQTVCHSNQMRGSFGSKNPNSLGMALNNNTSTWNILKPCSRKLPDALPITAVPKGSLQLFIAYVKNRIKTGRLSHANNPWPANNAHSKLQNLPMTSAREYLLDPVGVVIFFPRLLRICLHLGQKFMIHGMPQCPWLMDHHHPGGVRAQINPSQIRYYPKLLCSDPRKKKGRCMIQHNMFSPYVLG